VRCDDGVAIEFLERSRIVSQQSKCTRVDDDGRLLPFVDHALQQPVVVVAGAETRADESCVCIIGIFDDFLGCLVADGSVRFVESCGEALGHRDADEWCVGLAGCELKLSSTRAQGCNAGKDDRSGKLDFSADNQRASAFFLVAAAVVIGK
jgi:hypothetical protein